MKIKFLITSFLLIIICSIAEAQSSKGWYDHSRMTSGRKTHYDDFVDTSKKITGRFNVLGMLDPYDENFSIGAEYKFSPHWSSGADVAYIFNSAYLSDSKHCQGFILRPFIRFYPNTSRRGYFEVELYYKHVAYQLTDWLGKDVVDVIPSYEEYTTFHFIKNAYGVNIKAGSSTNLTKDRRFRLEYYLGLGIRFKKQHADNGSYSPDKETLIGLYRPNYATTVLPVGIRLVYDLKTL